MSENDLNEEKVREILLDLEESKREELEKTISEKYGEDNFFIKNSREDRIKKLKQQLASEADLIEKLKSKIEKKEEEINKKEAEIKRLNNIDKLEKLPDVKNLNREEVDLATAKEREKVANKFQFLVDKIRNNDFLAKSTLKSFDFYREKIISRCLKEEEYWEKLNNL